MFYIYLIFIALLGALTPVQTSSNAKAQQYLKSPIVASLCSFLVGSVALLFLVFAIDHGLHISSGQIAELPWWAWTGGAAGVIGITANILLFPRLGSTQTVLMPMIGQIIAGFLVDSFGLFGFPVVPVSAVRFIGFIVVLAGVFFVVTQKEHASYKKSMFGWRLAGIVGGASLAMQPPINSQLVVTLGSSVSAAFISFVTGTILLVLICCAFKQHRQDIGRMFTEKRPLWTWLGGLIGVVFVVAQAYLVRIVSAGLLTILNIFGMLVASVIIDNFGLLGAEKLPVTKRKVFGLSLVLIGIILLNI